MHGAVAGAGLARRQGAGQDMMRHGLAIASALLEVAIVVLIFCVALGEVLDGLPLANRWQAFVCGDVESLPHRYCVSAGLLFWLISSRCRCARWFLVAVVVRLVGTFYWHADVVCLRLRQGG